MQKARVMLVCADAAGLPEPGCTLKKGVRTRVVHDSGQLLGRSILSYAEDLPLDARQQNALVGCI